MKTIFLLLLLTQSGTEFLGKYASLAQCNSIAKLIVQVEPGTKAVCLPMPTGPSNDKKA